MSEIKNLNLNETKKVVHGETINNKFKKGTDKRLEYLEDEVLKLKEDEAGNAILDPSDDTQELVKIKQDITSLNEDKLNASDVVDSLTSTSTIKPLSAKQGKELKTQINTKFGVENLNTGQTINSQYTDDDKPITAKSVKPVKDLSVANRDNITAINNQLDLFATKDTVYTREQLDEKFNEVNQTLTDAVVGLAHTSDLEAMQQIMSDLQTELNNLSGSFRLQLAQNGWLMEHISDNNIQTGIRLQNASGEKVDLKINGLGESVLFFTTGTTNETINLNEIVTDDELSARIDEVIAMVSNTVQETEILLYDSANNINQLSNYNFGALVEQGGWEAIVKFNNPNTANDYLSFTIQNTGQSAYGNTGMDNDFGTTLINPDGLGVIEMMTKRWFHWNGQTATRLEIQEWVDARDAGTLDSLAGGVLNVTTSRSNAVYFIAATHDIKKFTIRRVGTNSIGG